KSGEKKALQEYRDATAKRHKILGGMAPMWKELKQYASDAGKSVAAALETTKRIDAHMTTYEQIRKGDDKAVLAQGWQSTEPFVASPDHSRRRARRPVHAGLHRVLARHPP